MLPIRYKETLFPSSCGVCIEGIRRELADGFGLGTFCSLCWQPAEQQQHPEPWQAAGGTPGYLTALHPAVNKRDFPLIRDTVSLYF